MSTYYTEIQSDPSCAKETMLCYSDNLISLITVRVSPHHYQRGYCTVLLSSNNQMQQHDNSCTGTTWPVCSCLTELNWRGTDSSIYVIAVSHHMTLLPVPDCLFKPPKTQLFTFPYEHRVGQKFEIKICRICKMSTESQTRFLLKYHFYFLYPFSTLIINIVITYKFLL